MKKLTISLAFTLLIFTLLITACSPYAINPTSTVQASPSETLESNATAEATKMAEDILYVNLVWHQHQPLYYKDADGVITRPWVRVHATKDYYDMAAMLQNYPNVHVTFNLTPVLIRQLDDYAKNGAKDVYWVLSEKAASSLSEEEKDFILRRFFDANWKKKIALYPRYQELLDKRGGTDEKAIQAALSSFSEQDYRDLQIWFNLAWFDPDFLTQSPLKELVERGRNFTEADKQIVFTKTLEIIQQIVPLHKQMQESGQIEVITTPYAHPILPLLIDTNLAKEGNPSAETPVRFSYPQDALAQLEKSVQIYEDHFGAAPRGLWPGEGAVAQVMVPFVNKVGYQWMATGEPVLAKSLGIESFSRDSNETVQQADDLYRPYYVKDQSGRRLAIFFRDGTISDKIGFTYSGVSGKAAAADLMQRLENIRSRLKEENAQGPHIVSIILDGENAWENYDNDGKEFLNNLYQQLGTSSTIKTITPSEYLKLYPEQRTLDKLFPAAWFSPNYDTWIGEAEETTAWEYLGKTRAVLEKYNTGVRKASPEALAAAQDFMYLAEGSDWFWWYGADQDSGQDEYFDIGFRALLRGVYTSLGEAVPPFVDVPIIQAKPVAADRALQGLSTPVIDGVAEASEWDSAALYSSEISSPAKSLAYTMDAKNLYFQFELGESLTPVQRIGLYFAVPRVAGGLPYARMAAAESQVLLGIAATTLVEWSGSTVLQSYLASGDGWTAQSEVGKAAAQGKTLEFSIPLTIFGELQVGDELRLVAVVQPANQLLPLGGPAQVIMPDLGTSTVVMDVEDPEGDDHGPGGYTYPTDAVFQSKVFDAKRFSVGYDETNIIFKIGFAGPIPNPWGSGSNLSLQTIDVYIDKDPGAGSGARLLLPGRNAALKAGFGWDYALWAEGWTPQVLAPDASTFAPKPVTTASFKMLVDPAARTVTLRIPKEMLGGGDPAKWAYAVAILSQEGYPSSGVWRVRDVLEKGEQWKFGGGANDTNHTRIIDLIWPADAKPTQEEMLSTYPSSTAAMDKLTAEEFPQIEMLTP